jgi:hypothetical protein
MEQFRGILQNFKRETERCQHRMVDIRNDRIPTHYAQESPRTPSTCINLKWNSCLEQVGVATGISMREHSHGQ